jgi:hypothetical protein
VRVAVVTTSYPAYEGDACGHFVEAEAALLAARARVTVVTAAHRHEGELEPPPRPEEPATVLRLPGGDAFGWPGVGARLRAHPPRALGACAWVARARLALTSLAPLDRVVAHWAVPCAWPVSTGLGVPLDIVSHGGDVRLLTSLPSPLRRAIVRRLLRDARSWRFVSETLLGAMLASLGPGDARRVAAIARVEAAAIDVPDVEGLARETRAPHVGVHLAVCVGRLVRGKRVDLVIDHVASQGSPRSRLVVVGDGPLRASLERRARDLGVDARFVGRTTRPRALAWIAAADLVLHASEAEGLSTVEREAAALGVPFLFVGDVPTRRDLR